jgi:hypothetical protein
MVYVAHRDGPDAHTVFLTAGRSYELSSAGEVVGVELEVASQGIDLTGIPVNPVTLVPLLEAEGLTVRGFTFALQEGVSDTTPGYAAPGVSASLVSRQNQPAQQVPPVRLELALAEAG